MYVRFLRWASDRLSDDGIVAFVSNSSFLHKNSFDGVRAALAKEFNELWVIDLKGDARSSGDARKRQGGNIFGDQIKVGVAVYILIRRSDAVGFKIYYDAVDDYAKSDDKIAFLNTPLEQRRMTQIRPSSDYTWLDQATEDTDLLLPLANRQTKSAKIKSKERAIFKSYSLGVSTNRDDWLYDRSIETLAEKASLLVNTYNTVPSTADWYPDTIKWSRNLKRRLAQNRREPFSRSKLVLANYRPFSPRYLYKSDLFIDEPGLADEFFPSAGDNMAICFSDVGSRTNYCALAVRGISDLHFGAAVDAYQQAPRYRFLPNGERIDNITDWALNRFIAKYGRKNVTKDTIFYYIYAILHDPIYHRKFQLNLKREFPRIPFYPDFEMWSSWGNTLLEMHLNYADADPWPIIRVDNPTKRDGDSRPKPILRSQPDSGLVVVDSDTRIGGIPSDAWRYRLGNRSAIDWILDQHKERSPRDPIIKQRFNSYRLDIYKESMITLIAKIVRISIDTVTIVDAMARLNGGPDLA